MSRRTVEISSHVPAIIPLVIALALTVAQPAASNPLSPPIWVQDGDVTDAAFGASAATAGDVNADGYDDFLVGAPFYTHGENREGRVYLYLGSPTGPGAAPAWFAESNQPDARFGWSLHTAGDVNADGYDDVVIGAERYTHGEAQEGAVFLYLGSPAGLEASPAWTVESDQMGALLSPCGTAGDVNGDGYDDVVVGASRYSNGQSHEGRAWLYLGSATGLASSPAWTAESDQAEANDGTYVATAGDVNSDGFADVVVGAEHFDAHGLGDEGRAYLYLGSAAGLGTSPAWFTGSGQSNSHYSASVTGAGDVNGDGYDDVLVAAHLYHDPEPAEGAAFVYLGSPTGLGTSPAWTWQTNQESAQLWPALGAGDVNGDGYDDIILGSDAYDNGENDEGRAFLFLGSQNGPELAPAWSTEGNQAGAYLGFAVGTAGDVNGDGFSDVVIGATRYDSTQVDAGRAWVYAGQTRTSVTSPAGPGDGTRLHIAPNPSGGMTRVTYELSRDGRVRVSLFDLAGRRVRDLVLGNQSAGPHTVSWNGRDGSGREVPAGVYLVSVKCRGFTGNARIVYLR